jgi:5-(carboxyamino)imidazole ribonucleotide synthase
VTYEREQVDTGLLLSLEAEGHVTRPSASTLLWIQDKYVQKTRLRDHGVEVPAFMEIRNSGDLRESARRFGYPFVLKRREGGYDGKGIALVRSADELEKLKCLVDGTPMMAEQYIDFISELSVMVACSSDGGLVVYPIAQNVHEGGILKLTIVPADVSAEVESRVRATCQRVMQTIADVGVFCMELFLTTDGHVLVNEIAPRPHNSGHYTIEACACSQFENHVRAVLGWPLGSPALCAPAAVMVNLLGSADGPGTPQGLTAALGVPGAHIHIYGKARAARGRKMGHVTALGTTPEAALAVAQRAADYIRFE